MRKSTNGAKIIIGIIVIGLLIASAVIFTPLENPFRDAFAETVTEETIVYINSTEFIEIIEYINSTEWVNTTEWINNTEWINTTEYIYITEYLPYPFVEGWNISGDNHYIRFYKQASVNFPYRFSFYNQLTSSQTNVDYTTYINVLNLLNNYKNTGAISQQQYDCGIIQLFILVG